MYPTPLKNTLKKLVFCSLGNKVATAHRVSRLANAGKSIILNLHRVGEPDQSAFRALKPALLRELIVFLKKDFYIVPLDAWGEKTSRPRVVLSFDDGYRDFIEITADILDKFRIRANLNVIPKCI